MAAARSATTPGAAAPFDDLPQAPWMLSDRGYDADWCRGAFQTKGITPSIPGRKSRITPIEYGKRRYQCRSHIEIMVGRLKDWRRVATRYDRYRSVLFSAVALAATVIFWLRSTSLEPGIYRSAGNARARDGRRSLSGHRTSPLPIHRRARPTSRCGRGVSTVSARSLPTVRPRVVRVRQIGPRYADAAAPGMEGGGDHRQAGIQAGMGTLAMLGDKASPIGPSPV